MKIVTKAIAVLMLMTMFFATGFNKPENQDDDLNGHAYVDLGLPSGTLWATCNVGADTPEGYGDYFAWGETQTKSTFNWCTYRYCKGNYDHKLTKYCSNIRNGYNGFTDNLTVLQPNDDAATVNWGSDWCMPTRAQWEELYQNTTHTWKMQNGVYGILFTASYGASLFLPTAGYRCGSKIDNAGSCVDYWSSSLNMDAQVRAWGFYGDSSLNHMWSDGIRMCSIDRCYGRSVRAVRSARQN